MTLNISNYTGYEDECEVIFTNSKGEYVKTLFFKNLKVKLYTNIKGNYKVGIESYNCIKYDDLQIGTPITLNNHETLLIEEAISNIIDWESFEESKESNIDDFMCLD
jgi:hypothetical protein